MGHGLARRPATPPTHHLTTSPPHHPHDPTAPGPWWTSSLRADFTNKVVAKAKASGKRAILWDEALELGDLELPSETIIQAWRSRSHTSSAARRGVGALVSHGFYLDHFEDWEQIFKRPISKDKHVVGGEACSWAEHADEGNLDDRLGIKLAASAHQFWSGSHGSGAAAADGGLIEAKRRLAKFRCHLRRRGWRIGPVIPDYCPVEPLELLPHQLAAGVKGAEGAAGVKGAAGAAGAGQDQASRIASVEPVGTADAGADRVGAAGAAAGGSAEGWCDGMSKEEMLQQVTRARSEQGRAEAMLQQTLLVLALVMAGLMGAALLKSAGRLSEFTASLVHLLAACVVCAWCWRCRGARVA